MVLCEVHIKNYKCILDSGIFSIDKLTCLVGKNESGKSAILQALYKLNPVENRDTYNELYEYPKMFQADYEANEIEDGDTVVVSTWKFSDDELLQICNEFGKGFVTKSTIVTVSNGYKNSRIWNFDANMETLFVKKFSDFEFDDPERVQISNCRGISDVREQLNRITNLSEHQQAFKNWFDEAFPNDEINAFAERYLLKYLPKFSYFAEYQRLPGKIAISQFVRKKASEQLSNNEKVFDALLSLAGTSIEEISNSDRLEALINKIRSISSKITREIFSYWSQNKYLKVEFRYDMAKAGDEPPYNDGYIFSTRIENTRHESSVSFDDRSAGFVWFFSFLIWFDYLQKKENNLLILLDEPGLSLHAKAQGDLIRFFKDKITPKFQLIYTTHSPFMLDINDILSARTVEDMTGEDDKILGTKVGSKVLSKDKDTTFPLQAAFGYDITQTLFIGKNVLLVEGPSDILYLTYFSNKLNELGRTGLCSQWTLCPSGGIDKIQSFVSLFGGNALNIATFTDYHLGDKNKIDRLKNSGLLDQKNIYIASDYTEYPTSDIEDIIGSDAYTKLINVCYSLHGVDSIDSKVIEDGKVLNSIEKILSDKAHVRFDHYKPSYYLIQNPDVWETNDIVNALDRFERFFSDVNALL